MKPRGTFKPESIEQLYAAYAEKHEASEDYGHSAQNFAEAYDFARCQRPDGSFYGTSGQCRLGKDAGAKEMTPTEKLKQGAASNPAVMRREKDKATAAAKTKGMFERAAQRRAGDEKTKEAKAVAKLESDLAALDAKMKPMLDKGGLIKKGLHSEYSKLVDEANTIRNQLTQLELARKGIQVPSPKQGPRKPTGKEKIDTQLAKRAQSEHESIKRLIKDGFLDRDSGGREEMMKLLGLTQREINFELAGRNLDDRDLYYMSNKDFGKLVLGLSQDRLKKNSR